jgi:hypothetical protein
MLKNMTKVILVDLSWPLFRHNILVIDDCPYKCVGNVSFSYILPHPFDNEIDNNNYLLASLWLYSFGLSKALNTLGYVGLHHHGQK